MKKGFSLGLFLFLDLTLLLTSFTFFSLLEGKGKSFARSQNLSVSVQADFKDATEHPESENAAIIVSTDARSTIIDTFLEKYKSPMNGVGNFVVETADKYDLPFWLVPAISMCESNLGKRVPEGSFNAWGWGVYGDKVTKFLSWEQGIESVSKGLSQNYLGKGLDTPEKIMQIYTPSSNGSWANCVNQFLAELK